MPEPPTRHTALAARQQRSRAALAALAGFAAAGLTYYVFVLTAAGQRVDQTAHDGSEFGRGRLTQLARPVLEVVSVGFIVAVLAATITVAFLRRRWRLTLQVAIVLGGANLATQILKKVLLPRPDLGVRGEFGIPADNSLPSGHTTVAAAAMIAVLLVVPRRMRGAVAIGGVAYVAATGVSTLIGGWHRPSDVVAAVFLTFAVGALAIALVPEPQPVWSGEMARDGVGERGPAAALALGAALAGLASAWALVSTWSSVAGDVGFDTAAERAELGRTVLLTAYAGGALAVIAATCACAAFLLLLLPRGER